MGKLCKYAEGRGEDYSHTRNLMKEVTKRRILYKRKRTENKASRVIRTGRGRTDKGFHLVGNLTTWPGDASIFNGRRMGGKVDESKGGTSGTVRFRARQKGAFLRGG